MEWTGVGSVTFFRDLDFRTFGRPNCFPHFANLLLNARRELGDFRRHVTQGEEFPRVNFTLSDKLIVDVAERTLPNLEAGLSEHPRLKRNVWNVNILQCRCA